MTKGHAAGRGPFYSQKIGGRNIWKTTWKKL